METLILLTLLLIAAETTYLAATQLVQTRRITEAPVFIDTSVLIDGRIIAIAESGFMTRPLYIPRSVVGELQFLADNGDSEKRARARHGLDVISQLQAIAAITVKIFSDGVRAEEGVDNRLLTLAKKHHGSLCTIDYNLNKVAVVEGIEVLNVNDLAKTLRMAYLPGEKTTIELTQKGNDSHQAVGHLADGTMVVVEQAAKQVGQAVEVEFIRSLQTAAGKMMFAKLATAGRPQKEVAPKRERERGQKQSQGQGRNQTQNQNQNQNRQQPDQSQNQGHGTHGARPVRNQTQAGKSGQSGQPGQSSRSAGRPGRRSSPEDSLVELANRS